MATTIINIKTKEGKAAKEAAEKEGRYVYCGRPTKKQDPIRHYGNPFVVVKEVEYATQASSNEEAVQLFAAWLNGEAFTHNFQEQRAWILENLDELRDKVLGCFCKPRACHCEIYVDYFDINPKETTMKETTGNLWTHPADVRVITTNGAVKKNGECVMGRGCAREARDSFPGLAFKLGSYIAKFGNRAFNLGKYGVEYEATVATFPTKHHWKEQADIELIKTSAQQLVEMADKFGWTNIVLPRPGCGNGGLNWDDVKPAIENILDSRFTVITFPNTEEK